MEYTLRDACFEDVPFIRSIYAHHVLTACASFEEVPPDAEEMARRMDMIRDKGLPYLVAEKAGVIAGYAYAAPYRPRTAYRFTVEDSIYLDHHHLGRGLGRALLDRLIAGCEAAGKRQMIAVVGDSANQASIRLHEAAGFRRIGTMESVGFKFDRWVDCVLLQRPLGHGSSVTAAE